ncbi:hemolysin-III related-domain-containing protein [Alternaria rosae]|uniref:hemolysin-III related-domain-containing protein n=1 Tax=Alternaria rosae TaxID=1187941 RepID=UPI001E8E62C3|nr:hemolysin-III related-domain-containing protein [Alternaria rosae]KAH6877655.1 hemolysin-III related-domain-containing protein [Alternaria rosae]
MTSQTCQDAREKAGTLKGSNHGDGYGTTTILRHVQFDAHNKETHSTDETQNYDALIGWDDLLPWQRDNEFILTSHRRATFSYLHSLKSVFQVHNETVNIWSHILGTVTFFLVAVIFYLSARRGRLDRYSRSGDDEAVHVYFVSVIVCFFLSFLHHIFLDHSESVRTWTGRFDYLGIVIPLYGTTIASTHFTFNYEPVLQEAYSIFATVVGLACAVATLHPSFSGPQSRHLRTALYLLLGASSFLPIAHGIHLYGVEDMNSRMSLGYYLGLGVCHGTGAMLYAARVPERWYPRRCDVVGSSHQLMHVLVVGGAALYGLGVQMARKYWETRECGA